MFNVFDGQTVFFDVLNVPIPQNGFHPVSPSNFHYRKPLQYCKALLYRRNFP